MGSSGCCRFGWYPKILAFFVTAGLGLSATSSLYCDFMTIVLDFTPGGYYQNQVGLGLWSFESPLGQCVSYVEAYESGGLGMGYSDWFMNKDFSWTVARILAMTGGLFGTISLIAVLNNICRKEPRHVDILAYAIIVSFLSEGSKFGLFFDVQFCASPNYWYNDEKNEFTGAERCELSQGAFFSIGSIAAYFISMIMAAGFASRPKASGDEGHYDYEENSLASWMQPSLAETNAQSVAQSRAQSAVYKSKPSQMSQEQSTQESSDDFYIGNNEDDPNINMNMNMNTNTNMSMNGSRVMSQGPMHDEGNDTFTDFPPNPRVIKSSATRKMDDMSVVTWDPY